MLPIYELTQALNLEEILRTDHLLVTMSTPGACTALSLIPVESPVGNQPSPESAPDPEDRRLEQPSPPGCM